MRKFGRKLLAMLVAGVLAVCGMPVVSAEDTATEQGDEYPIHLEIGTSWATPEKLGLIGVGATSDGTVSAATQGFVFRIELPDATAELLSFPDSWNNWVDDTYYMLGILEKLGFQNSSVDVDVEQRITAVALNYDNRTAIDVTASSNILTLLFAIPDADTVATVAEKYDIPLQTGTYEGEMVQYYSFPVNFADRDITYSRSNGTTTPGFQYLDDSNAYVDIMDQVGLKDGCVNVMVAEESAGTTTTTAATTTKRTTTTATTTATTSSTASTTKATTKSTVPATTANTTATTTAETTSNRTSTSAGSTTASATSTVGYSTTATTGTEAEYPIYLEVGTDWIVPEEDSKIDVRVTADGTVDAKSYGIAFQFAFPDATAELLGFPDSWESKDGTYWTYSPNGYISEGKLFGRWGNSADAADPTELDSIFTLYYTIPDADTITAVAEKYNIPLQTGAHNGKTVQYYAFPVNFADRDTTVKQQSGGKDVETQVLQYVNEEVENIADQVGLRNGYIYAVVSEESPAVTTVASTTTTTAEASFTIALPADANLIAGATIQMESSVPAADLAWFSSDKSIATVDSSGVVTLLKPGTVSILATDSNQIRSVTLEISDGTASVSTTTTATTVTNTDPDTDPSPSPTSSTTTTTVTATTEDPIAATTTADSTSSGADTILYGDLNLDGRIELKDAVLLSKATSDAVDLGKESRANGDCNADGVVDGSDVVILLQFLVKIIDRLPYIE